MALPYWLTPDEVTFDTLGKDWLQVVGDTLSIDHLWDFVKHSVLQASHGNRKLTVQSYAELPQSKPIDFGYQQEYFILKVMVEVLIFIHVATVWK